MAPSLNLDVVTGESREELPALAEQAFNRFWPVPLIAVFCLVLQRGAGHLGGLHLLLGTIAGDRLLGRASAVWREGLRPCPVAAANAVGS